MEEKLNKSDVVFNYIQKKISSGEWKAGDRIDSEVVIANNLKVSRVTVRAAIDRMIGLDILTKKNGGRTYVSFLEMGGNFNSLLNFITLDKTNLETILEFRMIIEVSAIKLFVKNCDEDDIIRLEEIYQEILENIDNKRYFDYDYKFHHIIARGTKNSILEKIYKIIFDYLSNSSEHIYETLGRKSRVEEHKLLLEALKNKDVELAEIYMKRHIGKMLEEWEK